MEALGHWRLAVDKVPSGCTGTDWRLEEDTTIGLDLVNMVKWTMGQGTYGGLDLVNMVKWTMGQGESCTYGWTGDLTGQSGNRRVRHEVLQGTTWHVRHTGCAVATDARCCRRDLTSEKLETCSGNLAHETRGVTGHGLTSERRRTCSGNVTRETRWCRARKDAGVQGATWSERRGTCAGS
ncbi:hypothetical protein AMTR_s00093p00061750 [Amborella trichopoda]|uniref:Uncharacterized protein n=1 Tax=Amborella trichopoda TaxID=13333 RepID=W1NSU3_AMBTC|nr:hypothetical protein AMTR_s00093p00061750 [Amborella trichopoda]